MLRSIFGQFSVFGFSGSRSSVPSGCFSCASLVPAGSRVLVGCARGVDEFFRSEFPTASVYRAADFGSGRGSFAARSVAVVRAVSAAGGLWVSFPSSLCPVGLVPSSSQSQCFSGRGSGSWASLAFALGLGIPCLAFLGSLSCPPGWGLAPVPGCPGWFSCDRVLGGGAVQLSLF